MLTKLAAHYTVINLSSLANVRSSSQSELPPSPEPADGSPGTGFTLL